MKKKILKLLILLALTITSSAIITSIAMAEVRAETPEDVYISLKYNNPTIFIDFKPVEAETPFLSDKGVSYVPLRKFADAFGANIDYNENLTQYTVTYKENTMLIQENERAALINNRLTTLAAPPVKKNASLMVPLRAFTDFVGANIEQQGKNTLIIQKGKRPSFYEMSRNIIYPPDNTGRTHTYTVWDRFLWSSDCGNVIHHLGGESKIGGGYISFNDKGFVTYGDYYAAALSAKFGNVGDMLLVVQDDNSVYPVMIADHKRQNCAEENSNEWGHLGGQDLVEFEILSRGISTIYGKNDSNGSYAGAEFDHYISRVINLGSIYDKPEYIKNVYQALADNGLTDNEFISV